MLSHSVGEPKRTWQVVADAGLYDYDILNNANYKVFGVRVVLGELYVFYVAFARMKDVIEELARKLSSPKAKDDSKRLGAVTCFGALKRRGGKVAPLSNDIEPADKRVEVIVVQPDAGDAKHATDVEAVPRGDADEVSPASGLAKRDSVQGSNKQRLVSPSQTTQAAFEQSQRVDPPGIVPQTNVEYKM